MTDVINTNICIIRGLKHKKTDVPLSLYATFCLLTLAQAPLGV
jgi:hypothetical protein